MLYSLFLVQQLLQSLQKKAQTLMTEVIHPTRKKNTHQKKQLHDIQLKLLLPRWFIISRVDLQKQANTNNIVLTSEEISHSD